MKRAEENPSLSFIVGLIIMVVIIAAFILAYANIFSDKEVEKIFDEFVENLNSLSDGEEGSMLLYMKEGSAILGFTKDTLKVRSVNVIDSGSKLKKKGIDPVKDLYSAEEYFINSLGGKEELAREDAHFDRPSKLCKENKACICLCMKFSYDFGEKKYVCEGKIKCELLDGNKDFLEHINAYKLGYHEKGEYPIEFLKWVSGGEWNLVDGGFALERLQRLGLTAGVDNKYPDETREVYFERKGNIIGVCLDKPCIFEKSSEVSETKIKEEKGGSTPEKKGSQEAGLFE